MRVPAYSPWAVAEHAVTLLCSLNRCIVRASLRAREHDFFLRGLVGRDIHGKVVGCVGTGKIGRIFCNIMKGFGATVLAYDVRESEELKALDVAYVSLDELLERSDFVSLHCPLLESTRHLVDDVAVGKMKPGALLVNCGRGGLGACFMPVSRCTDAPASGPLLTTSFATAPQWTQKPLSQG
jgi:D-lactate dehydrogenase